MSPVITSKPEVTREQEAKALKHAYMALCAHPLAEPVLRDLCEQAAVFSPILDMMSGRVLDPATHGFHEGKRALALRILALGEVDLGTYAPWARKREAAPAAGAPREQITENSASIQ